MEIGVGGPYVERMGIGDQLYGAKFPISGFMNGWDDRQGLMLGLAAIIPATKVFTHMRSSKTMMEDIIPMLMGFLSLKLSKR